MELAPDITTILGKILSGDGQAVDELLPLVYDELRRQAAIQMADERTDHTLQATALVHDVYLRLVGQRSRPNYESQQHFFAAAATAMRRILIDHARAKARHKRGGNRQEVELTDIRDERLLQSIGPDQLLDLDDALSKFERIEEQVAELVRLRLYAGLSMTEAAKVLGISRSNAYEQWDYAMSWFAVELGDF